ncbi:hypothetical protein AVEN_116050-1, partial [Araneus ventricosus]
MELVLFFFKVGLRFLRLGISGDLIHTSRHRKRAFTLCGIHLFAFTSKSSAVFVTCKASLPPKKEIEDRGVTR